MAAGGRQASFDPLRIQKLLFLADAEIADAVGGPRYRFRPCDYGPFDPSLYADLRQLSRSGLVKITPCDGYASHSLTSAGFDEGSKILEGIPADARTFLEESANWLLLSTPGRILSVIFRRYPEMAAKTIVPHLRKPVFHAAYRFAPPSFLSGVARLLDFTGSLDRPMYRRPPAEADALAMRRDWEAVGDDLEYAFARLGPPEPTR